MTLTDEQKSFFRNEFSNFWPFIQETDFEREPLFHEMEKQCREIGVHSVGPWFGRLLNILTRFGAVTSALEFGTATGYSAIWIARDLPPSGKLITIERDAELAMLARQNIARAGLQEKVEVRMGEAQDIVPQLKGPFDLLFVDCAHFEALEFSRGSLRSGGLFVCDNVGFHNKEEFNQALVTSSHLETLYLQCYLKGKVPENTALSLSIQR
jgi:predicted O-methyltransferase YrrM